MSFNTLGRTLSRNYGNQVGMQEVLLTARVVFLAKEVLGRLWPAEQAAYVRVASFLAGRLLFEATSGAAAQALKMQAMPIQNALNRELGGKVVLGIDVRQA